MTPCDPTRFCAQRDGCARWRSISDEPPVDGTSLLSSSQRWCPLFVDRRGMRLVAATPASAPRFVYPLEAIACTATS